MRKDQSSKTQPDATQPAASKQQLVTADIDSVRDSLLALPDEQKTELLSQLSESMVINTMFSGPIPPPVDFEKYEKILPGAAERILAMPEKEQQIRADGQQKILSNDSKRINVSALLGIAMILVAALATWKGSTPIAISLGLAGVISTIFRQVMDWLKSRK